MKKQRIILLIEYVVTLLITGIVLLFILAFVEGARLEDICWSHYSNESKYGDRCIPIEELTEEDKKLLKSSDLDCVMSGHIEVLRCEEEHRYEYFK